MSTGFLNEYMNMDMSNDLDGLQGHSIFEVEYLENGVS